MTQLISVITFFTCCIIASVVKEKIDSIITTEEYQAKRIINPILARWILIMAFFVVVGTASGCLFVYTIV
jgi:hypothetical protein